MSTIITFPPSFFGAIAFLQFFSIFMQSPSLQSCITHCTTEIEHEICLELIIRVKNIMTYHAGFNVYIFFKNVSGKTRKFE
jgi:hypothetical protein